MFLSQEERTKLAGVISPVRSGLSSKTSKIKIKATSLFIYFFLEKDTFAKLECKQPGS